MTDQEPTDDPPTLSFSTGVPGSFTEATVTFLRRIEPENPEIGWTTDTEPEW